MKAKQDQFLILKNIRNNMPAAPRLKNRATKIAFSILGTPANIKFKRSAFQQRINKELNYQESSRIR